MTETTKKAAPLMEQEAPRRSGSAQVYHGQEKKSSGNDRNNGNGYTDLTIFLIGVVAGLLAGVIAFGAIAVSINAAETRLRENARNEISEVVR